MYFKNQVFDLWDTTNNRLDPTFNKIKSVCSKYSGLIQVFAVFFIDLKSLRSEQNQHFLMSLVKKSTGISTNAQLYKNYADLLTLYAFSHLQGETKKVECVKVLQQMDPEKY